MLSHHTRSTIRSSAGFLAGGLIGLGCGWFLGNEFAVVVGFIIGAVGGTAFASRLSNEVRDRAPGGKEKDVRRDG